MPQVMGWIYFSFLISIINVLPVTTRSLHPYALFYEYRLMLFFPALVCIATFGYLFNDLCDIDSDALAGKPNSLSRFTTFTRVVVVAVPLLAGVVAWFILNWQAEIIIQPMLIANVLFVAQLLALIMYSAKPFRLKDRAGWGVVFDAFYGHLNPVLITFLVFNRYMVRGGWYYLFMGLLVTVCFIKGIRNILLHQVEDRKKDSNSKINTIVLKYGPWRVISFINRFLFPAEVFFLLCLTVVMSLRVPPCIIPLIFFAIVSYLKMSGWKLGYADRRLVEFKFTYFMNDYYENWLPVFLLIILSVYAHQFVFLLILHLILFPMFIIKLVKDFKVIKENFKTEEDY